MKQSLFIAFVFSVCVECINKLVPLIVINFAQKRLGVESFGYAQVGIALLEITIPFVIWGYHNYGIIELGNLKATNNLNQASVLISNIIGAKFIHALLAYVILVSITFFIPSYHKYFTIILFLSFVLLSTALDGVWILIAIQQVTILSIITFIGRFLSLLFIILFISKPEHAILYAVLTLMSNTIIALGSLIVGLKQNLHLCLPVFKEIKIIFNKSMIFGLIAVIFIIFNRVDLMFCEYFLDIYQTGLYSGAVRLNHSLLTIIIAATLAFFSESLIIKDNLKLKQHIELSTWVCFSISVPVILITWFFGHQVLTLILGDVNFAKMHVPLGFLTTGSLLEGLIIVFGFQVLLKLNKVIQFFVSLLIGLVVWLILSLVSVYHLAQVGLAGSVMLGKMVSFFIVYFYSYKLLGSFNLTKIIRTLFAALLMYISYLILININLHFWFINLVIIALVYVLSQIILNFYIIKRIFLQLWRSS